MPATASSRSTSARALAALRGAGRPMSRDEIAAALGIDMDDAGVRGRFANVLSVMAKTGTIARDREAGVGQVAWWKYLKEPGKRGRKPGGRRPHTDPQAAWNGHRGGVPRTPTPVGPARITAAEAASLAAWEADWGHLFGRDRDTSHMRPPAGLAETVRAYVCEWKLRYDPRRRAAPAAPRLAAATAAKGVV